MHLSKVLNAALLLTSARLVLGHLSSSDAAAKQYLESLQSKYIRNTIRKLIESPTTDCNIHNVHVRQSWDDMKDDARQEYLRAVKCMAQQPTRSNLTIVPGARNWIDDLNWQHVEQTNFIHGSALLLPWHRQFVFAWEKSLRETCNYTGAQPYWDWSRHAYNQSQSPVFRADSFGGNGAFVPHNTTVSRLIDVPVTLPPRPAGSGGGCVTDGPFAQRNGWQLNIGLVTPANDSVYGSYNTLYPNNTWGQQYQPRCLKRDFYQPLSSANLNYTSVQYALRKKTIAEFEPLVDVGGLHTAVHGFLGDDGNDFYASPNEPLFYLHHAQLDRLWATWQAQDFDTRGDAILGTTTFENVVPSANATLETIMEMGISAGGKVPIRAAMSATDNGLCYLYI